MNLPNLSSAKLISLDVETKDPGLKDRGPSTFRGGGYICGVSVATDDGFAEYLPVRHEGEGNLDRDAVWAWLRDQLGGETPKLGANIGYDLEWLRAEGITVGGPKLDVQTAQALLDENRESYSLDAISKDLLGVSKDEAGMTAYAVAHGVREKSVKENIWRLPAEIVAPYGRQDVLLPIRLWERQRAMLDEQGLGCVMNLETDLVDALLEMRFMGVRVDQERATAAAKELDEKKTLLEKSLKVISGKEVDYWSNKELASVCERLGLAFARTAKGNPSFEAEWLAEQEHPFLKQVAKVRLLDRAGSVFIRSKILGEAVNGRIHCQLYSVRGERGGTRSGRFSCANPNLQQVPARNEELSRIIRSCFVPEDDEEWLSSDWSQVEPRVTVHYAEVMGLRGAKTAGDRYRDDPETDYHQMTAELADIARKPAKTINLGLSYGMGREKLAVKLGLTLDEATALSVKYHEALPFIKLLGTRCSNAANQRGYVRTLLGRRSRFESFGPAKFQRDADNQPLPYKQALEKFGPNIRRYFTHKAMNRAVQGTAAELMKLLIVELHKKKLTPNLTVHDEVCKSVKDRDEARRVKSLMENIYPLRVPLYADTELGPSWGEAKEVRL